MQMEILKIIKYNISRFFFRIGSPIVFEKTTRIFHRTNLSALHSNCHTISSELKKYILKVYVKFCPKNNNL